MLHPSIEIRSKDTIHGHGLFATQIIPEGALVWELKEPIYTLKEIEAWPQDRYDDFRWYGFQCGVDKYSLPEGDSREMNHSCDPNTWGKESDKLIARREIQVGEEVTYDYSTSDIDLDFNIECHCGASNCRGTITNRDYLDAAWQKQYGENLPDYVLAAIHSSNERLQALSRRRAKGKTIVILRDRAGQPLAHTIDHLALCWKDAGYQVINHIGLAHVPDADLYIVHIDLTVIPQGYVDLIAQLPLVINGNVTDISRRQFSQILLSKDDAYDGPVIIKTNANYGGMPEYNLRSRRRFSALNRWSTIQHIPPLKYPVRKSLSHVPKGVWKNEHLVVEPFIENRKDDLYYVCYYVFFGDKEYSGRIGSPHKIVKFNNSVVDDVFPLPDEVRQWRRDLQIDFGRLDYLEQDGKYFLIDVNKTEGGGRKVGTIYEEEMAYLASGLDYFLE